MIGIVIAGHGNWPSSMKKSAQLITGKDNIEVVEVDDVLSADQISKELIKAIDKNDYDKSVVLLDLFGGSPMHGSSKLLMREDVLIITGANLAMLLELLFISPEVELEELSKILIQTGRNGIKNLKSELLEQIEKEKI